MEEKKNNKDLVWLIVILIVLVLGLAGYIVFDKVLFDTKETINENTTSTTTTTIKTSYENKEETINLEKYMGIWYEEASNEKNLPSLNIKKENNIFILDLYLTRIGNFNIKLNNNYGTFVATSKEALSKNDNEPSIEGTISFLDDSIKINITKSNVLYLEDNQEYVFDISFDSNKGEFILIEFNENSFSLYDFSIEAKSYQTLDNEIKNAKIFNSPLSSDASESAFIIMENGDVYLSYFGEESNELKFMQYDAFKEYNIEDIISCDEAFEQKCEVILKDGSRKTI